MFRQTLCVVAVAIAIASAQLEPQPLYRMATSEIAASDVEFEARADEINYRLPNNTIPKHYDVSLWTRVDQADFEFNGIVEITLTALEDSTNITLHTRQITVLEVTLREADTQTVVASVWDEEIDTEFLVVDVTNGLVKDRDYVLWVNYTGTLRTDQGGFYRSSYVNSDGVTTWLATTQFESTNARHGFPCYDEPATKATFTIRINHGDTYMAESNMPVVSITPSEEDDTVTTLFETTPPMSTYLIAYVISDFAHLSKSVAGAVPQRVYSAPTKIGDGQYSLDLGVLILEALAEHLDVPFSLPKMDQFAIPDFAAGAMENWGLVTYREEYLLYNELTTAYNFKTSISTVISHEYAHQWFGNLVTPKWWTYIWLNEGFATLFEVFGVDLVHPEWKIMEHFAINTCQNIMGTDVGTLRPMTHYVESPSAVSGLFDGIAYSKSGCVLRMWQNAFTTQTFQKGLKYYLEEMQYSAAVEEDLFAGLSKAIEEDNTGAVPESVNINDIFLSWTRQSGYPCITVTRNYETGAVSLSQQAFRTDNSESGTLWWVPFSFSTASNTDSEPQAVDWIRQTQNHSVEGTVNSQDWFILNNQQTGYYRVNYDEPNWSLITNALLEDHTKINIVNRAQLINDAFTFARLNLLDYTIPLGIFEYLKNDAEYVTWQAAYNNIGYVNRLMAGSPDFTAYKAFVSSTVDKLYTTLGVNPVVDEFYFNPYSRAVAINLACAMGHEKCLTETHARLAAEVNDGVAIETNLQNALYCNGLRTANAAEFKHVFDKLIASTDTFERSRITPTLSCVQDEDFIMNVLQATLGTSSDNNLSRAERLSIFQAVYSRGNTHVKVVLEFFKDEELRTTFISRFTQATFNTILNTVASYVVTADLQTSYEEVLEVAGVSDALKESMAAIVATNFDWVEKHGAVFSDFLKADEPDSATAMSVSVLAFASVAVLFLRNMF